MPRKSAAKYSRCIRVLAFALGGVSLVSPALAGYQDNRFTWIDVPYDFSSPGVILPGATNCTGTASGSGEVQSFYNNVFGGSAFSSGRSSASANCTSGPTIFSAPSSSRRTLRVHVDCINKTYDAKGDGIGWKSWDAEQAVYRVAVFACAEKGFGSYSGIDIVTEEENRRIIAGGRFTYEWCVTSSIKNVAATEKALYMNPGSMGLEPAQVALYINKIRASIPVGCEKAQQVISSGGGYDVVQASVWSPIQAEALESILRIGR